MKRLITMTEYVLKFQNENLYNTVNQYNSAFEERVRKYAQLLQNPLSLDMFIPCKDGEPIEKPIPEDISKASEDVAECMIDKHEKLEAKYQEALDNVLFEGWRTNGAGEIVLGNFEAEFHSYEGHDWLEWWDEGTRTAYSIESLINSGIELTPTESCKKIIGL
jgi:hypothetical protein